MDIVKPETCVASDMTGEKGTEMGRGRREKDRARQERSEHQPVAEPELKTVDELGFETVEYRCWKCARLQYREKNGAEAYLRNGKKLFCMPCERPDLFIWEVEELADGTKREYIRPLSHKEIMKSVSPEARELAGKQAIAQILRARRAAILKLTQDLEIEYMSLGPAIAAAEKDVEEAQMNLQVLDNSDQLGKKVRSVQEVNAAIMRLVAEIEAAKKANEPKEGGK